jgi:polyhydroxybutyrate depolymerase
MSRLWPSPAKLEAPPKFEAPLTGEVSPGAGPGSGSAMARKLIALLALVGALAVTVPSGASERARSGVRTVTVRGVERQALVRLPAKAAKAPVPLLVLLHGAGDDPAGIEEDSGMTDVAMASGFAVAYPAGLYGTWNAGGCCLRSVADEVPDELFLVRLIRTLVQEGTARRDQVYVAGFSNGGMMAYRLACSHRLPLAGVGAVGGALVSRCPDPRVRTVVAVHGADDALVPTAGYDGTLNTGQHLHYPPLADAMATLARGIDCEQDGPLRSTAAGVDLDTWYGCRRGGSVTSMVISGLGHDWPGNRQLPAGDQWVDATAALVERFELGHPVPQGHSTAE